MGVSRKVVFGDKQIIKNLRKAGPGMVDALGAAIMREAYAIQAAGQAITPVEFGTLRRSWYVAPPKGGTNPVVELGVGTKYAIYVHERNANYRPPGQWKYIQTPVVKARAGYINRVASTARRFFEKGVGVGQVPKSAPERPSTESGGS